MKIQLSQKDVIAALELYFSKTFNKPMEIAEFDFTASRRPQRTITVDVDVIATNNVPEANINTGEKEKIEEPHVEVQEEAVVVEDEVSEEAVPATSTDNNTKNLFG